MVVAIIVYILIGIVLLAISVAVGIIRREIVDNETLITWVLTGTNVAVAWPLAVILGILLLLCYGIYRLINYAKEISRNE